MAKKAGPVQKKDGEGATIMVERVWSKAGEKTGGESTEEELIEVPNFSAETARVSTTLGMTLNMGNYESVKISVSVSLPTYPIEEEMVAAYKKALDFTQTKLKEQIVAVKSKRGGGNG